MDTAPEPREPDRPEDRLDGVRRARFVIIMSGCQEDGWGGGGGSVDPWDSLGSNSNSVSGGEASGASEDRDPDGLPAGGGHGSEAPEANVTFHAGEPQAAAAMPSSSSSTSSVALCAISRELERYGVGQGGSISSDGSGEFHSSL